MLVIVDTREQKPWDLSHGAETVREGLKTGDYSIRGHEDRICIERKRSTGELSNNLGKDKKPFRREFERMAEFEEAHLICEFPMSNFDIFPEGSCIPKRVHKYLKTNGRFLKMSLFKLCEEFGVHLHFCDSKEDAADLALELLNDYWSKNNLPEGSEENEES